MKAELLKHSNFVILTILGEFLVKLCFTVFTFENRGGWFRFINSEQYHFRGNNTTSGETIPLPGKQYHFRGCLCCLLQAQLWSSVRAGQRAYTVAKHCFVLPWRREETARRRWPIPSRCPWCGLPSNLLESRSFPFSCSFHFLLMFDFNLAFPLLELDTTAFFKETSRKKIFSHDRNKIIAQKSNTLLSVKRKI